jgi:putative inorganic carbon (hco3(-)) transporter
VISYLRKIELFSLAGLLFILPFTGLASIKDALFFLLICSFAAVRLLDRKRIGRTPLPDGTILILILMSFAWSLITLVTAIDRPYSFYEIATKLSKQYLLFFLSFLVVKDMPPQKVRWLFLPLVLSAVIMSLYACYQFYQSPEFFVNRVYGFTGAFYRLSTFLVLSVPLAIVLAFSFQERIRGAILFIIPVLFAALFFTFTRGAWIAVTVEIVVLAGIFFKKYRRLFISLFITISLVVAGLSYESVIPGQVIMHGSEKPRLEAIRLSSDIIRKYPFTGIGYGKETFSKYYPDTYVKHAHNIFLNTAVETGVIGLLIFAAILAVIIRSFLRAIRDETAFQRKLLISGIFTSFIGFLSLNLFDYMYHGWPGQMLWMIIGIGYAVMRTNIRQNNLQSSPVSLLPESARMNKSS